MRKSIFETNIGPQHLDYYGIHDDIKNEIFTEALDNGAKGNVDNIQLNDSSKGEQIKTETVSSDVQLLSNVTMNDDFEKEESKLKIDILQFEPKMESVDYFLKEEEVSINDVVDANDTTGFEKSSERNSDTLSLLHDNQGIKQQESNEYSSSEHEVSIEISNDSKTGSSFVRDSFPKKEQKQEQLMPSRNSAYRPIKINNGFRCGLCPFQNELEAQVEVHFENYHFSYNSGLILEEIVHEKNSYKFTKKIGVELFKCVYCNYKTTHKKNLETHLKKHRNELSLYQCEHCDYKTKHKSGLKVHLRVHSNDIYKCEHCEHKFKYKSSLKRHSIVHSNDFYKCEHCDFKTKYKINLKNHLILHSNPCKFYKCEHCDYKTQDKRYLKKHSIVHSNDFFKCEHCDHKTIHKRSLKKHLIGHSDQCKFYKCEHCDYKTKHKSSLRRHCIVHSNDFYSCEHCGYKTKHKDSVKRHLIIVHCNDFYKCDFCDYKTKDKKNLKKHSKGHFGQ